MSLSFIGHQPIPDAMWADGWYEFKLNSYEMRTGIDKAFYGRGLCPAGSLIKLVAVADYVAPPASSPALLMEWVEFVHRDLLEDDNDVADGFGCELFAKVLYEGQMVWVQLNLAMYDYELLSSTEG